MRIFHLATTRPPDGDYAPASLGEEGFVHCSTPAQLPATVQRHYPGVEGLLVLSIDTARLTSELRWERSTGGEAFPHVYGPIDADAIVDVTPWDQWPPPVADPPGEV